MINPPLPRRRKIQRALDYTVAAALACLQRVNHRFYMRFKAADLRRLGVRITGHPRFIAQSVYFDPSMYGAIQIGHNVVISESVRLLTHDYSICQAARAAGLDESRYFRRVQGITLGEECFVGLGATIMPGVVIGKSSIVAAGAVVTKPVPDFDVVGGNPARHICTVFELWRKYEKASPHLYYE
jgi:maltose O-acetyltransferase